jgi:hypothetical protein
MSGKSLAAHCWRLHQAAEAGNTTAARRLHRLGWSGVRAGQCTIDLQMGWHRHPGQDGACDEPCPEASDGAAWAAAWELYWPPGERPGGIALP